MTPLQNKPIPRRSVRENISSTATSHIVTTLEIENADLIGELKKKDKRITQLKSRLANATSSPHTAPLRSTLDLEKELEKRNERIAHLKSMLTIELSRNKA